MDNTGRTFTFDAPKGSWVLVGGQILGGTLVLNNPVATLDISEINLAGPSPGNLLDGVTIDGHLEMGANHQDPLSGFLSPCRLMIRDGLTLNGTLSQTEDSLCELTFDGTQTIRGGVFTIVPPIGSITDFGGFHVQRGTVTFDENVAFRGRMGLG